MKSKIVLWSILVVLLAGCKAVVPAKVGVPAKMGHQEPPAEAERIVVVQDTWVNPSYPIRIMLLRDVKTGREYLVVAGEHPSVAELSHAK